MKKTRFLIIPTALLAMLALLAFLHLSGSRSALAHYKAELQAKGEKLTFKELLIGPSTKAEEVAAVKFLAGYSRNYSSLSGSVFPLTMGYVAPGKARVGWRGELRSEISGNWVAVDWKRLEDDNLRAAPVLADVRPALLVSPPDSGWVYDDNFSNAIGRPLTNFIRDRIMAQALQRDLVGELHGGNLDAALNDLHALIGQIRMNRNELTLGNQMIRAAIAGLTLNATWEALQAPGWDETRLAGLQREWEHTELLDGLERGMEWVRAETTAIMATIRSGSIAEINSMFYTVNAAQSGNAPAPFYSRLKTIWNRDVPWLLYRVMGSANADELTQLQFETRAIELARSLQSGRPWPAVEAGASNLVSELDRKVGADRFHRLKVLAITIPNVSRAFQTAVRAETLRRLTITAIAIKRYELKHNHEPPGLESLAPEFLSAVPIDPMSGKPLCYRLNKDGTFVLYSTGEDGKDDGGDPSPRETGGKFGLWEGRDAVWPEAEEMPIQGNGTNVTLKQ